MNTTTPCALRLPAELTIYTAGETRQAWLAWLGAAPGSADHDTDTDADMPASRACRVDGAAVDQVDAAGLQLLVALSRTLHEQQRALQLVNASAPLLGACRALGMGALLEDAALAAGDPA